MTRFLKTGLLLALVFGVVWLAVIIWWQESRTLPTGCLLYTSRCV